MTPPWETKNLKFCDSEAETLPLCDHALVPADPDKVTNVYICPFSQQTKMPIEPRKDTRDQSETFVQKQLPCPRLLRPPDSLIFSIFSAHHIVFHFPFYLLTNLEPFLCGCTYASAELLSAGPQPQMGPAVKLPRGRSIPSCSPFTFES